MDFREPLPPSTGNLTYHILMECLDTFLYDYVNKKNGEEFPSIRNILDVFLTYVRDIKDVDFSVLQSRDLEPKEMIEKISTELAKMGKSELVDSEKLGLLETLSVKPEQKPIKATRKKSVKQPETTLEIEAFIPTEEDIKLLGSCGIKVK